MEPPFRIEGPLAASYGRPEGAGEWALLIYFDSQQEAQGFAAWAQSDHPSVNVGNAPLVQWRELDKRVADADMLPPGGVIMNVDEVQAGHRENGRPQVVIIYRYLGSAPGFEPPAPA